MNFSLPRRTKYLAITASVAAIIVLALFLGPWPRLSPGCSSGSLPEITVCYSWEYTETIAKELQSPEARIFLLVRLTILNRGYTNFTADPFRDMYVIAQDRSYNVSVAYFFLQNRLKPTNLTDGASASGEVMFEVPLGTTMFQPGWRTSTETGLKIRFVPLEKI